MKKRYFLTIEWCNSGERGIFCNANGLPFSKETKHSSEEMNEILGAFFIILSPKSEQFSEKELKEFNQFRPLAEYTNQYGIALKKDEIDIGELSDLDQELIQEQRAIEAQKI